MLTGRPMRAIVIALLLLLLAIPVRAQSPVPGVPAPDGLTFTVLATTAGATVAAGIIFGLVQVIKSAFPGFSQRMNGAGQAFILSAILYVIVAVVIRPPTADGYLVIFISWLNCALAAVGIYSTSVAAGVAAGVRALTTPKVAAKALDVALAAAAEAPQPVPLAPLVSIGETETGWVEPATTNRAKEPDNA